MTWRLRLSECTCEVCSARRTRISGDDASRWCSADACGAGPADGQIPAREKAARRTACAARGFTASPALRPGLPRGFTAARGEADSWRPSALTRGSRPAPVRSESLSRLDVWGAPLEERAPYTGAPSAPRPSQRRDPHPVPRRGCTLTLGRSPAPQRTLGRSTQALSAGTRAGPWAWAEALPVQRLYHHPVTSLSARCRHA